MKKSKHSYFKDDIRKVLLLYAFFPAVILTFLLLLMFGSFWKMDVVRTNQRENREVGQVFENTISSFSAFMEELGADEGLLLEGFNLGKRAEIFDGFYKINNEVGKKGNLYIFNDSLVPLLKANKTMPYYLRGENYQNWGIFYSMSQGEDGIKMRIMDDGYGDWNLILGKRVRRGDEIEGYIVITLSSREFLRGISSISSQTLVTDDRGVVYLSNNYTFVNALNRFSMEESSPQGNQRVEGENYYFTSSKILDEMLTVHSVRRITNQIQFFLVLGLVLSLVFLLLLLLVLYSTKKMALSKTKDLDKIVDALSQAEGGDLTTQVDLHSQDEFQIIGDSFNAMIKSLKEQLERNAEMTKRLTNTQMKQLQAQFNPHFLYNTLDNIRFMVKFSPEDASEMILKLSALLRYSLDYSHDMVDLKEDLRYTESYLSIMNIRYSQRLTYEIILDEGLLQLKIPKLIIQPMIENALKYGFGVRETLHVIIEVKRKGEFLILTCMDNGQGMDNETLLSVQEQLNVEQDHRAHFGLYNIHRRLQLRYGAQAGVSIRSIQGEGTTLKIKIPLDEGVELNNFVNLEEMEGEK